MRVPEGDDLVGFTVQVRNKLRSEHGSWGKIFVFDGMQYHVAMREDVDNILFLDRDEFRVCTQWEHTQRRYETKKEK